MKKYNNFINIQKNTFFSSKTNKESENKNEDAEKDKKKKDDTTTSSSDSSSSESDSEYEHPSERAKYKNVMELYHDQLHKLEFTKSKFLELKHVYNEKCKEVSNIKDRSEKEIWSNREYAITKFAKDLLDVSDNFNRAFDSIKEINYSKLTEDEKIKTFNDFAEGI